MKTPSPTQDPRAFLRALYDTAVSLLHPQSANWLQSSQTPKLSGNAHSNIVPYDKFPTQTCEVFLGIGNNGQWKKLCEFLGHPDGLVEASVALRRDLGLEPAAGPAPKYQRQLLRPAALKNNGLPAGTQTK